MKQKLPVLLILIFIIIIILSPDGFSASYNELLYSSNAELTQDTYTIYGDFVVQSWVTLTVKRDVEIRVVNGNVRIDGTIKIFGVDGEPGTNGALGQSGTQGTPGGSHSFNLTAEKGNIIINGQIICRGGKGGEGGNGGDTKSGTDGGSGGSGGNGGNGGDITLIVEKGIFQANNLINSLGGIGGKGGNGGDDVTAGFLSDGPGPGDGNNGGIGGNGGNIYLIGQDVILSSSASLDVSPGSGGGRGDGGDGGSIGSDGTDGKPGDLGQDGNVTIKGGEIFYDSDRISSKDDISDLTINPSFTCLIDFERDANTPFNPDIVLFLESELYYQNETTKIFYTAEATPVIKIKVPEDQGFVYGEETYKSDIGKFKVYSDEKDLFWVFSRIISTEQTFDANQVEDDFFSFPLIINGITGLNKNLHLNIKTSDNYDNTNTKTSGDFANDLILYIDNNRPSQPSISTAEVNGRNVEFSWNPPTDQGSGVKNYDIKINNVLVKTNHEDAIYTYLGEYNQQITCRIYAKDQVGNISNASPAKIIYTAPKSANIKSVNVTGNASTYMGCAANVSYFSVGSKAAKYQIKYFEVNQNGDRIYAENCDFSETVSSNVFQEGMLLVKTFRNLQAHKWYKFAICSFNYDDSQMTDWSYYGPIQVPNNMPSEVTVLSPGAEIYMNCNNAASLAFKTEKSTDYDRDLLTYTFIFRNTETNDETTYPGTVNDRTVSLSGPVLLDGKYEWYVTVQDGFIATPVESEKRILYVDKLRPQQPQFGVVKDKTNVRQIVLKDIVVKAFDVEKLKIWSEGYDSSAVQLALENLTDQNGTYTYTFTISDVEGEQAICMKTIDNAGNESEGYSEQKVTYDKTSPQQPSGLTLIGGIKSIELNWNVCSDLSASTGIASSGVDYYKIEYRIYGSSSNWLKGTSTTTSYTINQIGDNERYEVRVTTYDIAGNYSEVTTGEGYSLPTVGSFTYEIDYESNGTGYQHFITFTVDPGDFTKYRVKRTDAQSDLEWIVSSTLTYRENCLPNEIYEYVIETSNSNDESRGSDVYTIEIPNHLPEVPQNTVTGFVNQLQPTLGCNSVIDVDGDGLTYYYYIEEVGTTGVRTPVVEWEAANDSDMLYKPTINLKDGYTYYYKVGVDDGRSMINGILQIVSNETSFAVDITAPQITLSLPVNIEQKVLNNEYVASATVTITASDQNSVMCGGSASGLKELYYYWNEDTTKPHYISSGTVITVPHGISTLYVVAEDYQGNVTEPQSIIFKVDETGPSITNMVLEGISLNGQRYTTSSSELFAKFHLTEEETIVDSAVYCIITVNELANLDSLPAERWVDITLHEGIEKNYEILVPSSLQDGEEYYFVLKSNNSVGIETEVQSNSVKVDSSSPVIQFTDSDGKVLDKYKLSGIDQLTLQVNVQDLGSGVETREFALASVPDAKKVTNWYSDTSNLSNLQLQDGQEYYLMVRATDKLGLEAVRVSAPILIDSTVPVFSSLVGGTPIPGTDQYQVQWDPTYLNIYWKITDESKLVDLKYAIGTTSGGKDISNQILGNENGWLTFTNWTNEKDYIIYNLELTNGSYYVTLQVTNEVGLTQMVTTNPIIIDTTKEPCPLVKDDGFAIGTKEVHFTVSYPVAELITNEYYYRIIDGNGSLIYGEELINNSLNLPSVSITVDETMGITFEDGQVYYVTLGEMDNGQFSPLSYSDGIAIDTTAPEFTIFDDGTYFTAENVYLSWEASDLESGINRYYLKVGTSRGGDELTGDWIDLGNQNSTVVQNLNFIDGELYFATVKTVNRAGLKIEKCGDGFRIDTTPPPTPKVLRESEYTTKLNRLAVSWIWTGMDTGSGIDGYYYDILTVRDATYAQWKSVEIISGDPLSTTLELTDLNLVNGTTYYIAIKAVDKAGLESIGLSKGITADINAPTTPVIDDLRDYQDFTDQLTAQFYSQDDVSGISDYQYAIGTLEDQTLLMGWTQISNPQETVTNLNLVDGEVYFFTALATDNAGHRSTTSRSDGILIDLEKPSIVNLKSEGEYNIDAKELFFSWEGIPSHTPIMKYEYDLTTDDSPTTYNWKSIEQEQILLTAEEEIQTEYFVNDATYYIYIRAIDASGKVSDVESAHITIDSTPPVAPEIIQEGVYQSKNLKLSWKSKDLESGIARYRYGIGTVRGQVDVTDGWVIVENTNEIVEISRNDLNLKHNQRYYLVVQAQNNAGVWSEIGDNEGFLVDLNPPTVPDVAGPGEYVTSNKIINELVFSSDDSEVGIKGYRYEIIPAALKDEITSLTTEEISIIPSGNTYDKSVEIIFDAEELTLVENDQYYVAVQAKNTLGMWSDIGYSAIPFTVDTIAPIVHFVKEEEEIVTNGESISVKWTTDEIGQVYYMVGRSLDSNISDGLDPHDVTITGEQNIDFSETEYGDYYLFLYMTDLAGNESNKVTQKIRVNEPPYIQVGSCDLQYKGRDLVFDTSNFTVGDHDGELVSYKWEFDDDTESVITQDLSVIHAYSKIGEYTVKLTVTDNDGGVSEAQLPVTITNTLDGSLILDEVWSGNVILKGDITVPQGVALTIEAGTVIIAPVGKGFVVNGSLICNAYLSNEIVFTTYTPDGIYAANLWKGIYLSNTSIGSQFCHIVVEYAEQGLGLNQQEILIMNSVFKENGIGIHITNSNPVISDCLFEDSFYYGIKEEGANASYINNNIFSGSGLAPYYHNLETLLTGEEINQFLNGSGNSEGVQ